MTTDAPKTALSLMAGAPYDPEVNRYTRNTWNDAIMVASYADWATEQNSWKTSAYLHENFGPISLFRVSGPEAVEAVESLVVNGFSNWEVGAARHAIAVSDEGLITYHTVFVRTPEGIELDLPPDLWDELRARGGDGLVIEQLPTIFNFQVAGPNALAILEAATGANLRGLRFMRYQDMELGGVPVRALRMGMGGSLAYEVTGPIERVGDAHAAVLDAGEAFGLQRIGWDAFMMNHTENGYPQASYHFLTDTPMEFALEELAGSVDDLEARKRTPFEVNWGHSVKFDHDFRGREALEREAAAPRRTTVSLVWNPDDIADLVRAQFESGARPVPMTFPMETYINPARGKEYIQFSDWVLKDGEKVGVSSGRCFSDFSRVMLSMGTIDIEHAEPGTELMVLWGEPGTAQRELRVTVARFPYLEVPRNQDIDVSRS